MTSTVRTTVGLFAILLSGGLIKAQKVAPTPFPPGDDKAKVEWVKSSPEAYRQMGGQVTVAPVAEAGPHQFASEAEKSAWIAAHPKEYALLVGSVQGAAHSQDFPKYVDTGNPKADSYAYLMAKQAWIAAHPQEYAAMTQSVDPTTLPDYPQMVNTGNPKADEQRYNADKAAFKKAHNLTDGTEVAGDKPVMQNTGDSAADLARYNKAKEAYKASHNLSNN